MSQEVESTKSETTNTLKIILFSLGGLAIVLFLVACCVIAILLLLGPAIGNVFSNIVENLPPTPTP